MRAGVRGQEEQHYAIRLRQRIRQNLDSIAEWRKGRPGGGGVLRLGFEGDDAAAREVLEACCWMAG